jgi:hypothetical protein
MNTPGTKEPERFTLNRLHDSLRPSRPERLRLVPALRQWPRLPGREELEGHFEGRAIEEVAIHKGHYRILTTVAAEAYGHC